jgi:hypothetical protein
MRETVEARQLDVEQDDLGLENRDDLDGPGSVRRLTDDLETLGLQQGTGRGPKALMVIDDEHGWTHNRMVPYAIRANIVAGTNAAAEAAGKGRMRSWFCQALSCSRIDTNGPLTSSSIRPTPHYHLGAFSSARSELITCALWFDPTSTMPQRSGPNTF